MKNFEQWLRQRLERSPSKELDARVYQMARNQLGSKRSFAWTIPVGGLVTAGLALGLFLRQPKLEFQAELSVPSELLVYQEDLELMVDTSSLSDEEWKTVMGDSL